MAASIRRGWDAVGVARHGVAHIVDIESDVSVNLSVADIAPDIIVNAAAMTDLAACEVNPERAAAVNSISVGRLAGAAESVGARFIHISTDQYWAGEGASLHDEDAPPAPVNEYGRSKLSGEKAALEFASALVLRTNVTGPRGWAGKPTFAEWLCGAISAGTPLTLFDDYYTSTIDSGAFAEALLDLGACGAVGLLNVAARDACHKAAFAFAMGRAMGISPNVAGTASVLGLRPRRAESAGLDCRRAESLLGRQMPDLDTVCRDLARQVAPSL